MRKHELPKNWIVVNSRSHPDRIYYFNIETNKSTWRQPVLGQTNKTSLGHISKRRKNDGKKKECLRAVTPEHDFVEDEVANRKQSLRNKSFSQATETDIERKDTPQMKMLRERLLQRRLQKSAAKNKISDVRQAHGSSSSSVTDSSRLKGVNKVNSPLSKRLSSKLIENKTVPSPTHSKLAEHDRSISLDQNDKTRTFASQMYSHNEKIQQGRLADSNLDEKEEVCIKNKQQRTGTTNKTSMKMTEKQKKSIPIQENIFRNKRNLKQDHNGLKKNLARERMQRLRNSLKAEEIEAIACSEIGTKSLQRVTRSLPASHSSESVESASIYKNAEVRLKRLHSKILKDKIYEKRVTLRNKPCIQPNKKVITAIITKDKLIEQIDQEVTYEEMDWEPMKDEEITLEVEVIRTQLGKESCTNLTNCISENAVELTQPLQEQEKGPLYIVIDTNVFLSNLEIIEEARDAMFKNYPRPFIVIPWTVICELDYLKDDKSRSETLRIKARKAISFLNKHFSSKHPRIIGQIREQALKNKEDFSLDCPDDEILQCCLQIRELRKSVVLLSYDKNLCTKAMIYDITALGRNDPLEKIDYLNASDKIANHFSNNPVEHSLLKEELFLSDDIFEDTKTVMKDFLSAIIIKEMSDIYGSDWEIYVIIKPPWTIVNALKCVIKHWIAAISESFQRRSLSIVQELLQGFQHLPAGGRKLYDTEHILEKCSDLLQMVNVDKHHELLAQSFDVIKELKKKCLQCITDINQKKLHDKIGVVENAQEQEHRAEKVFQRFKDIYSYARDFCGVAASVAGMAFSLNFCRINPPLPDTTVKRLQPEIARRVIDLTQNLNKLLIQAENSLKYQTLLTLQQDINTFVSHVEMRMFDVELLDIYYCVKLKEDALKLGLKQLQELSTHYCALAAHI